MRISDWSSDVCSSDLSAGNSPQCAIEDLLSARGPRLAQLDWHFGELKVPGHWTIVQHHIIFSLQAEVYGRSRGYRKDDEQLYCGPPRQGNDIVVKTDLLFARKARLVARRHRGIPTSREGHNGYTGQRFVLPQRAGRSPRERDAGHR